MPTNMMNRQGSAPRNDFGPGASGAAFFRLLRCGFNFAIPFRCYPMRLLIPLICLFLFSCAKESVAFAPPALTEGGWKLGSKTDLQAPDWMQRLGLKQAVQARYAGPIEVHADIYELRSEAAALECSQLWKRVPGDWPLIKRNLFIVIRSPHPNREMLMDFSRALEKAL